MEREQEEGGGGDGPDEIFFIDTGRAGRGRGGDEAASRATTGRGGEDAASLAVANSQKACT